MEINKFNYSLTKEMQKKKKIALIILLLATVMCTIRG